MIELNMMISLIAIHLTIQYKYISDPKLRSSRRFQVYADPDMVLSFEEKYRLQIYAGYDRIAEGDFNYKTAENPGKQFDKGIYLCNVTQSDKKTVLFQSIMVPAQDDCYFLPYRTMEGYSFYEPWFSNKYIHAIYKRTKDMTLDIYIYFPYYVLGGNVPNENCQKILEWFQTNTIRKKASINLLKAEANSIAANYTLNYDLLKQFTDGKIDVNKEIEKLKANITSMNHTIKAQMSNLRTSSDISTWLEKQIAHEQMIRNELNSFIQNLGKEIDLSLAMIDDLEHNKDREEASKYKNLTDKFKEEYLKVTKNLENEAPQAKKNIEEAQRGALELRDMVYFQMQIKEIAS